MNTMDLTIKLQVLNEEVRQPENRKLNVYRSICFGCPSEDEDVVFVSKVTAIVESQIALILSYSFYCTKEFVFHSHHFLDNCTLHTTSAQYMFVDE